MNEFDKALIEMLNPAMEQENCHIDFLSYKKGKKENILTIYLEKDDYSSLTLDDVVHLSEILSLKLDETDPIKENYSLDVSTSGAMKEVKDFSKLPLLLGKYFEIRLKNPIDGENIYLGYLNEVNDDTISLSYRIKTREKVVIIDKSNINKATLTVKL